MRISWACSAPQDGATAMKQGDELPARQLGERGDRLEIGVGAVEEVLGQAGQCRAESPNPPGTPHSAGRRDRVQPVEQRQLGPDLAGEAQIDRDVSVHAHDDLAGPQLCGRGRARQHDRFSDRFPERRYPQIVLELRERVGKGLGDRTGAVDRPARDAADLGRDRARLQQPHPLVRGDRPLDVLWSAEHGGGRGRQVEQPSEIGGLQLRSVIGGELDHLRVRRVERVPGAVDLAAHQLLGPAVDGAHHAAVAAPGHRVAAEHHAAVPRLDQRLDEHGDRMLGRTGPLPRLEDRLHRGREGVEPFDADDRLELAGHRGRRHVLDDGRTARHQRLLLTSRLLERLPHGRMPGHVGPGIERVGERGRQHQTRQRRQSGRVGPRQRGRFSTRQRGLLRGVVMEVDDVWTFDVGDA